MPQIHWIIFSQNLLCIYPQNDVYTLPSCIQHLSLTEYVNDAVTLHEDPQQIVKMLDLQQDTLTDPNTNFNILKLFEYEYFTKNTFYTVFVRDS